MSTWFISDLHLDPARPEGLAALQQFLHDITALLADAAEALYILGDLFEMWVGDDDDDPFATACCDALARFAADRPLFLLHGNRDFLLRNGFIDRTGATLLPDPSVIDVGGRRALVLHGDSLCIDDADYMRLRAQLRSPEWQADILARPLAERRALGNALRAQSRAANANKAAAITDVNEAEVLRAAAAHDATLVIHGHTHRPATHHRTAGSTLTRIVLGDWAPHGQVLRVAANGRCGLLRSDRCADAVRIPLPRP